MKTKLNQFIISAQKVDPRYIQLVVVMAALVLMILGVSAPDDGYFFGR